jgi:hypothetical protein
MTENACQTSLENKQSQVTNEEIQKLKEENFILQGKLRGYATLGNQIFRNFICYEKCMTKSLSYKV